MRIKYDKQGDTLIVYTEKGDYRISLISTGEFILEEIVPPYGELSYVGTYKTVGNILELLLLDEIEEIKYRGG